MHRLNLRSHFPNLINQSFWFVHRPNLITLGYQKACRDFYSWEFEISGPKWRQISIFNWMIRIADIIKTWIANTSQIIEIGKLLRPGIVEHRNLWRTSLKSLIKYSNQRATSLSLVTERQIIWMSLKKIHILKWKLWKSLTIKGFWSVWSCICLLACCRHLGTWSVKLSLEMVCGMLKEFVKVSFWTFSPFVDGSYLFRLHW